MTKRDEQQDMSGSRFNHDVFSKVLRAGKRTYFFDVKATRQDEYYLTITESKRRFEDDGQPVFEKHKIFLYREDFSNFMESLTEIFDFITENQPSQEKSYDPAEEGRLVNVEFEDLSK
jgi:hypothetical protein